MVSNSLRHLYLYVTGKLAGLAFSNLLCRNKLAHRPHLIDISLCVAAFQTLLLLTSSHISPILLPISIHV